MHLVAHQNKNTQNRRKKPQFKKTKSKYHCSLFLKEVLQHYQQSLQVKTKLGSPAHSLWAAANCEEAVPWHAQDKVEIRSQLEEENFWPSTTTDHSNASRREEGNQLNCEQRIGLCELVPPPCRHALPHWFPKG